MPIKLEPCSNTEFDPPPTNAVVVEAVRRARIMADARARKLGMPRRRFLLSSMGAATTLAALSACSRESSRANGDGDPGGEHDVSDEAGIDQDAAREELGDDRPVIDVQTHFLEYPEGENPALASAVAAGVAPFRAMGDVPCDPDEDPVECLSTERWVLEVFGRSDTTMAVISALPFGSGTPTDPLSAEIMADGQRQLAELCAGEGERVLVQGHGQPNAGNLDAFFDAMEEEADTYDIVAWKSYTHVGAGWMLDDSLVGQDTGFEGHEEPIGERYLAKIEELHGAGRGPNVIAVHKGFSNVGSVRGGSPYALPTDIGPAATGHPDLAFCVYHSGFELGVDEGPYDPDDAEVGVNALIKSLQDHNIEPGANVYAELGGTWRTLLTLGDDTQKAHVLGKLLLYVGEDRILWGTDSIWFGSPQDQIEALRTFQITPEFQDRYGYPELTDAIKQKIFWENAADLHGIDPVGLRCDAGAIDPEHREEARQLSQVDNVTYGPKSAALSRRMFLAAHPWAAV